MSQVFTDEGKAVPVTLVKTGPLVVTQIKNKQKDGYDAVQVGFGTRFARLVSKALQGHLKASRKEGADEKRTFRYLREFRVQEAADKKVGDVVDISIFAPGDIVAVSGISKGKGFQGVVKRHGFAGGPRTHGQKHSEREAGSIGGSGGRAGGRVAKGMRMPGRMGGERATVKNLKVVAVDAGHGVLAVSGAIPGRKGTLLEIRAAK